MQPLNAVDAGFLGMESVKTPMHVGGFYLYELPPDYKGDFYENFKTHFARRMHLFPVLTRKLAQLPFSLDVPLWVHDDHVNLDFHIRRLTLPKPGRFDQLEALVGQLHAALLDRSRPLWEIYIIDGLADGRVAEYAKFHHAGFDGAAAMAFLSNLYDPTPVPREVPPPVPRVKEELDLLKIAGLVYTNALRQYAHAMHAIPDILKAWAKLTVVEPDTLKLQAQQLPWLSPWTRLNGSITNQRSYAARTVLLSDVKRIGKANGATVNDVVMAMCGGALRRYLGEKNELPPQSLTAFVPVSMRELGDARMNNQIFGMVCLLGSDVADPLERLHAVRDGSKKAKRFTDTIKAAVLGMFSPWGVPFLLNGLMDMAGQFRVAERTPPLANLTISNNVGSPVPLYIAGAKMVDTYPISIPTHGNALNVTVQSYDGRLEIGITACRGVVPDVSTFADYVVEALAELDAAMRKPVAVQEAVASASIVVEAPALAAAATKKRRSTTAGAANRKRSRVTATPVLISNEPKLQVVGATHDMAKVAVQKPPLKDAPAMSA